MTIVILGGGIGGLSTAHYLLKNTDKKVILLEASNRLGGWIRSTIQPNGLIFENGPRTLRPGGEAGINTLNLIEELNLTNSLKPVLSSDSAAKNRYVYINSKLHALPTGLSAIFRKKPPFSKPLISAFFHDYKTNPKFLDDDSIYNFVHRRFGSEIADYAISPLICGICGGDAKKISVNFLLRDFFQKEQNYGSIIKGFLRQWKEKPDIHWGSLAKRAVKKERWSSYAFHGGIEILPKTLASKIENDGATVITNTRVTELNLKKKFITTDKDEIPFDRIISTIPPSSLAPLVYKEHFLLAQNLKKIPYVSIITVNLAYNKKVLDISGFGFLVPPAEKLPILGVVFDSCYAPHDDWTNLTVMMGGHAFEYFANNHSDDFILKTAVKHVNEILNIKESPDLYQISILRDCIPQQVIGHDRLVQTMNGYIEYYKLPLKLVGNAYRGTGINDVMLSARETSEKLYEPEKVLELDYDKYC